MSKLVIREEGDSSTDNDTLTSDSESSDSGGENYNLGAVKGVKVEHSVDVAADQKRIVKKKPTIKQRKRLTRKERSLRVKSKQSGIKLGMVKPSIVKDRERERALQRIAARGVTQLFNQVADHQKRLQASEKKPAKAKPKPAVVVKKEEPIVIKQETTDAEDDNDDVQVVVPQLHQARQVKQVIAGGVYRRSAGAAI